MDIKYEASAPRGRGNDVRDRVKILTIKLWADGNEDQAALAEIRRMLDARPAVMLARMCGGKTP